MIYQTSGTTSGKPKIVPFNYTWLDGNVRKMTTANLDIGIVGWR
jgi:hypothetical protein